MAEKGLFDELGIGSTDEQALLQQGRQQVGSRLFNQSRMLGQQASPLVRGAASAVGGIVTGKDNGRSFKGLGQNFMQGSRGQEDKMAADAGGITVEQLRARREIRRISGGFQDDGDFDKRIAMLKRIVATANRHGDAETVAAALKRLTEVEAEKAEFEKLGLANAAETRKQNIEKEVGYEAELVEGGKGKAVRINEGPNTGMWRFIEAGKEDRVVRGGDLRIAGMTAPKVSASDANRNSIALAAKINGFGPGAIGKGRAAMNSMGENTQIVSNIATLLTTANDPQSILSASGKTAIAADKTISFVESVSGTLTDPRLPANSIDAGTAITWNGKRTSTAGQRNQFVQKAKESGYLLSTLNAIAGERGLAEFTNLDDYLPPNIRGNAQAAEQYWANVMELAYLDARLMEPSNRGLSDNDVKMALKRIGADTANPASFAERQLTVIDTKLIPAMQNLWNNLEVPADMDVDKTQLMNFVYPEARRTQIMETLMSTRQQLIEVLEQGRRGENREQPDPTNEFEPDKTLDELKAELAILEAEEGQEAQ